MRLKALIFLFCVSVAFGVNPEIEAYLNRDVVVPDGSDGNRRASQYYILAAEAGYVEQLVDIIEHDSNIRLKNSALVALANILGGDNSLLPFSKVREIVSYFEEPDFPEGLNRAYSIAAYYNTNESLDFLKDRTRFEFWEGREMPRSIGIESVGGSDMLRTAQGTAISLLGLYHPMPEASEYLKSLLDDERYINDPYLKKRIERALAKRDAYKVFYERRQAAQALKDKLEGKLPENPKELRNIEEVVEVEPVEVEPSQIIQVEESEGDLVVEELSGDEQKIFWPWFVGVGLVFVLFAIRARLNK
jgi:hypothetical protein